MGAWGFKALDSDQALDWLADITDLTGEKIVLLLDAFEQKIEENGGETEWAVDAFAHELRAAGDVVVKLNFFHSRFGDLHERVANALHIVRETSDWVDGWSEPPELRKELADEIAALRKGRQSTTLMENL